MMIETIAARLAELEDQQRLRLLFACESGSRAWGAASSDSDWDIRFIYAQDLDWRLQLFAKSRDTITLAEGELDYHGWELQKALLLAASSNPSLLEWLASPIVYRAQQAFLEELRDIMKGFSPQTLAFHYASLARRQHKAYWRDGEAVRLKKYSYALRPLLALRWMAAKDFRMPPVALPRLLDEVELPGEERNDIRELLEMKRDSSEQMGMGRYPALDRLIERELAGAPDIIRRAPQRRPSQERLQALFRRIVMDQSA